MTEKCYGPWKQLVCIYRYVPGQIHLGEAVRVFKQTVWIPNDWWEEIKTALENDKIVHVKLSEEEYFGTIPKACEYKISEPRPWRKKIRERIRPTIYCPTPR